jgi:hypothetical protein
LVKKKREKKNMPHTPSKLAYIIQRGVLDIELVAESKHNWVIVAEARVDSGASMSSIDVGFIDVLRLEPHSSVTVNSASGKKKRDIVSVGFYWDSEYYEMDFNVADRESLPTPILLGRDWLGTE